MFIQKFCQYFYIRQILVSINIFILDKYFVNPRVISYIAFSMYYVSNPQTHTFGILFKTNKK